MRNLMLLLTLVMAAFASNAQANYYNNGYFTPNYGWGMNSHLTCRTQTVCANGRVIWCETFGYAYSNVPSYMSNNCRSRVAPGRAVQCQGYVQVTDAWGNYGWQFANIPVSCF